MFLSSVSFWEANGCDAPFPSLITMRPDTSCFPLSLCSNAGNVTTGAYFSRDCVGNGPTAAASFAAAAFSAQPYFYMAAFSDTACTTLAKIDYYPLNQCIRVNDQSYKSIRFWYDESGPIILKDKFLDTTCHGEVNYDIIETSSRCMPGGKSTGTFWPGTSPPPLPFTEDTTTTTTKTTTVMEISRTATILATSTQTIPVITLTSSTSFLSSTTSSSAANAPSSPSPSSVSPTAGRYVLDPTITPGTTVYLLPNADLLDGCMNEFNLDTAGGINFSSDTSCGSISLQSRLSRYFGLVQTSSSTTSPYYRVTFASTSQIQVRVTIDSGGGVTSKKSGLRSWRSPMLAIERRGMIDSIETSISGNLVAQNVSILQSVDTLARWSLGKVAKFSNVKKSARQSASSAEWIFNFNFSPIIVSRMPTLPTTIVPTATTTSTVTQTEQIFSLTVVQVGIAPLRTNAPDPAQDSCISKFHLDHDDPVFDFPANTHCGPPTVLEQFNRFFNLEPGTGILLEKGFNGSTTYQIDVRQVDPQLRRRDALTSDPFAWKFIYHGILPYLASESPVPPMIKTLGPRVESSGMLQSWVPPTGVPQTGVPRTGVPQTGVSPKGTLALRSSLLPGTEAGLASVSDTGRLSAATRFHERMTTKTEVATVGTDAGELVNISRSRNFKFNGTFSGTGTGTATGTAKVETLVGPHYLTTSTSATAVETNEQNIHAPTTTSTNDCKSKIVSIFAVIVSFFLQLIFLP